MSNKKSKKQLKPSQLYTSLRIFTGVAVGPLGFRAEPHPEDGNPRALQITLHDKKNDDTSFPPPETTNPDGVVYRDAGSVNEPTTRHISDPRDDRGDPAVASSARFGPLRAILGAISTVPASLKETVTVRHKIESLLPRIIALEARFGSRPDDVEDQRRRRELINQFSGTEGQLRSLYESQGMQQHVDLFQGREDVYEVLEDLQEAIYNYQVVHQTTIQEEEYRMMRPADASALNNFRCAQEAEYRHGDRKGCLRGTRRTTLDEIEIWIRDFDRPPIYWLNGLAGTGKSTIAQTIAERLFADGQLGASFFCSRDFEDRSNIRLIFPTLAVQLARRYSDFRSIFVPLVQSDPGLAYESLYNQMNKLIVRPLAKSAISTAIVIDALDECKDEEPASAILSVLGQFISQIPKVKFFLNGRPEPRILEGFRLPLLAQVTDVFVLHEVESAQANRDIQVLFRYRFSELAGRRRGLDDWPSEEQLDLLCGRAAGLFVYAMATIRFVGHRNNNPRKRLDRLLELPESSVLEGRTKFTANNTLDSLYLSILQEAFGEDDPEDDPKVRSILGAVILAANPLSPSAIATLLGFDTEDVFPLLSSAHSLLILQDDTSQPTRPFHKSFPDFIVDPARCLNPRFRLYPPDHHTELLVGCLELLNQNLEQNMCKLPDGVINSEIEDLKERTEQSLDQALQYACRSWHKHLPETIPTRKHNITSVLHQFLEGKFLFWLEVLSVLGAAREAVDALEAAAKWLNASPTLNLVNDYFRFVIESFEVINTSASHIYHSALFLSPKTSIVRSLYEQYGRPLVRVVQGLPASWEPTIATVHSHGSIAAVAWSPCGRLIAFAQLFSTEVELLDSTTLGRVKTLTPPYHKTQWLGFSPDGCLLTGFSDKLELTTWDLQTGGLVSTIPSEQHGRQVQCFSSTYSKDGKAVVVAYSDSLYPSTFTAISAYDLVSRTCIYSHRAPEGRIVAPIWPHGDRLRFTTVKPGYVTIWEVGFTSAHTPAEVKTFPAPDEISCAGELLYFHTPSRLAFTLRGAVLIWDTQGSRFLLKFEGRDRPRKICFSLDGRLFACGAGGEGIHVWKESPTGYVLHQNLPCSMLGTIRPSFSPNGGSIIAHHISAIQLWYTTDLTLPLSSVLDQSVGRASFILGFSPDETLAAVVRSYEKMITVLDLERREPRLTIDAGMEILCLGVTGKAVVVVGEGKVVTWNVPAGGCCPDARANIDDSVQTAMLTYPEQSSQEVVPSTLTPPDFDPIAVEEGTTATSHVPNIIENGSNETRLADTTLGGGLPDLWMTRFTPDRREVWCVGERVRGWTIIEGEKPGLIELNPIGSDVFPPVESLWRSPRGFEVTFDWWILSPSGKRLLWLPYSWRSGDVNRIWGGRFLGLLHRSLPEAVILELCE